MSLANNTSNKVARLRDRSLMLSAARNFFNDKGLLEVDCPSLCSYASVDTYIDLIPALYGKTQKRYLHSSPEYGMKRLLSLGMGDIYQLSHVFRNEEHGKKHNPEFMMAEWYRCGFSLSQIIDETLDFIRLFLGQLPAEILSYRETFQLYAGVDYLLATETELINCLKKENISAYSNIINIGKEDLLNLILGTIIEPKLGRNCLFVLSHYPASQAALAKKCWKGDEFVAERFEVYFNGVELANGYHELTHFKEQHERLQESNRQRLELGKEELPIDQFFLNALTQGIPESCGVAVGFDRLMMLRHKVQNIGDVIPFAWEEA